jgi:hypothetical protein
VGVVVGKAEVDQFDVVIRPGNQDVGGGKVVVDDAFSMEISRSGKKLEENPFPRRETEAISLRTLDVLSRYVGAENWEGFLRRLKAESLRESEEFVAGGVDTRSLVPGDRLLLGWLPDRKIVVEYQGDLRFAVVRSVHSSLAPGDSFSCLQFRLGHPLYLNHFRRSGSDSEASYVAGERSGLVLVERREG